MQRNYLAFLIFSDMNFCQMNMNLIFLWELRLKHRKKKTWFAAFETNKQIPFSSGLKNICPDFIFSKQLGPKCVHVSPFLQKNKQNKWKPCRNGVTIVTPPYICLSLEFLALLHFFLYKLTYNIRLASSVKHIVITKRQATACYHTIITKLLTIFLMLYI